MKDKIDLKRLLKGYISKRKYDGVEEGKAEGMNNIVILDFEKSLNQENPRNVFLNAQLYIENLCDILTLKYFLPQADGTKYGVLLEFLKSRYCSFFQKIELLKIMRQSSSELKFVEPKIIQSLITLAEIRNAFQHNLIYSDALKKLHEKKFYFINKKLKDYEEINSLEKDFKKEATQLHNALGKLLGENSLKK